MKSFLYCLGVSFIILGYIFKLSAGYYSGLDTYWWRDMCVNKVNISKGPFQYDNFFLQLDIFPVFPPPPEFPGFYAPFLTIIFQGKNFNKILLNKIHEKELRKKLNEIVLCKRLYLVN